jgi:hypothetical protein
MGPINSTETSVSVHFMPSNNPEDGRIHAACWQIYMAAAVRGRNEYGEFVEWYCHETTEILWKTTGSSVTLSITNPTWTDQDKHEYYLNLIYIHHYTLEYLQKKILVNSNKHVSCGPT